MQFSEPIAASSKSPYAQRSIRQSPSNDSEHIETAPAQSSGEPYNPAGQNSRHLMLLPSLACQAGCAYCFGPNQGPIMPPDVFDATLDWIAASTRTGERIDLTFHGGEPLIAGQRWYERNLPILRARFGDRVKLHAQSNLWLLDDTYCAVLKEHGVSLGTSLDGPEHINDRQRGQGYFARTMTGIETAGRFGLSPGVICTFTRRSVPHYREIFDFFVAEYLPFSIHAAVRSLNSDHRDDLALSVEEYADLLIALFDLYLDNITQTRISTFDSMARGISAGRGALCTFGDCLGGYLTIGPDGSIYSCNRFAHHPDHRLGSVLEMPTLETLAQSPAWLHQRERELTVHQDCGDCPHFIYCKGGCPYSAATNSLDRRDPHCAAYKRLFDHITQRALDEIFSQENLAAVVAQGPGKNGLMRKGKLLHIMRDGPHPQATTRRAREIVAAAALAVSASPEEALDKLDRAGIITRPELAIQSLRSLRHRLDTQSQRGLVNAYLHVTYACNLTCTHCYASSSPQRTDSFMTVDEMVRLVHEIAQVGFTKAVITGGEPCAHPERDALLDALRDLRQTAKPLQTVLRTNLVYPLNTPLLDRLAHSTDQVVVSVDGDEASHDARRGPGTYAHTVDNLKRLLAANPSTQVSITAVLTAEQIGGQAGHAVKALSEELAIDVRFKAVLPLGRGTGLSLTPTYYSSLDDNMEALVSASRPLATCGLGMNLYIDPHGECYPCYALMGVRNHLGNIWDGGLAAVLERNHAYRRVTVDNSQQCRACPLRYLCGGFCRAWKTADGPDAPPVDCAALYRRAQTVLFGALEILAVSQEQWQSARLPGA